MYLYSLYILTEGLITYYQQQEASKTFACVRKTFVNYKRVAMLLGITHRVTMNRTLKRMC